MPEIYSATHHSSKLQNISPKKIALSQQIMKEIKADLSKFKKQPSIAFTAFPDKLKFETQESTEEIVILLRQHMITNFKWIVLVLAMSVIPIFLPFKNIFPMMPVRFVLMTNIIWYLLILAITLENFLSWYFNVNIITDERIIDVDFYSLIYKRISEAKIDNVEDVSYSQGGFLQAIFNFGTVNIQTAAEIPELEFENVPNPARIAKVLNQLKIQEEQEKIEGRVR